MPLLQEGAGGRGVGSSPMRILRLRWDARQRWQHGHSRTLHVYGCWNYVKEHECVCMCVLKCVCVCVCVCVPAGA